MGARAARFGFRPLRRFARVLHGKLTADTLRQQRRAFRARGGTSEETVGRGFEPAFQDTDTGLTYPSRYPDGRRAPVHLLDGLPDRLVEERDSAGNVTCVKRSVVAGFSRAGRFYTRAETARLMEKDRQHTEEWDRAGGAARRPDAGE